MATYYSSWRGHGAMQIRLKLVSSYSQNVQANSSSVTIKQYIERQYYSTYGAYTQSHKLTHTGTTYSDNGERYWASNGSTLIQSRTKTITHNSNGQANYSMGCSCSAMIYDDEGEAYDYETLSIGTKTISLPTINRVSSITSNASSTTKFGDTINFTITRYNSNFTHDISYSMYNASGIIATGVGTSQNWTIPTALINNTPDNANPVITITCITKNGSTTIGTTQYTFNCKVPTGYVPTCSLAIEDIGSVPSGWNLWVKGKSILKGTITAEGSESSTIKSYSSTANDSVYNTNPFETLYLKYDGERTITSTVTDSRGRTATDSEEIEVVNYFSPTIIMCKVDRCLSDGTLNPEGTYGKATIQFKISPVNNLNAKTIKVNYGSAEISETATNYEDTVVFSTLLYGLETNATYNFVFSVIDSFDTVPQPYSLPPAFTTQSLLAGGKGVTFGQIATEEGLVSHFDNKFYKDTWAESLSVCGLKTECYDTNNWIVYGEDE
jgi:hypothetical protein